LQVAPHICYGQTDVDVAASFKQELAAVKKTLMHTQFDAVYTSPLQRCAKLALGLNMGNVSQDHRLKELHFGEWEMRAWNDIPRELLDVWGQNYAELSPPNGETFSQLQQRGLDFLDKMLHKHPHGNIAVVTHGGMIRALIAHVLNLPLKGLFRLSIDYGSVTQLEFGGSLTATTVPKINYINHRLVR
ncbi:MAG: alpha-ribazole phosphatase, partial [Methylophilaceae bacterium]